MVTVFTYSIRVENAPCLINTIQHKYKYHPLQSFIRSNRIFLQVGASIEADHDNIPLRITLLLLDEVMLGIYWDETEIYISRCLI